MKTKLSIIAVLLCANAVLGFMACSKGSDAAAPDGDAITCYAGGPGYESCEVAAGIEFDGGITTSCSVTCDEGYYACCGLECRCYPEE